MSIPGLIDFDDAILLTSQEYFWGVVDAQNKLKVSSRTKSPLLFKTRSKAREERRLAGGTVRKVYVHFETRDVGGA